MVSGTRVTLFPKKMTAPTNQQDRLRIRIDVRGMVQGVGFRPFVYIHAKKFGLTGFVRNQIGGVLIEVEGDRDDVRGFEKVLVEIPPPLSRISQIVTRRIDELNDLEFGIVDSDLGSDGTTLVSPDVAICSDCEREMFDPKDRRFRYPFINCTNCGPRFTITHGLPYDRINTTMSRFEMCGPCRLEYETEGERRFHAQPNACGTCGPSLSFKTVGQKEQFGGRAVTAAQHLMSDCGVVAVKGVGGFHLACDARNDSAIARLRERKGRVDKPFAVMCRDIETADKLVETSAAERMRLTSHERPIVLLRKRHPQIVSELIAPGNEFLGVMLPYSPLHHLMLNSADERYRHLDVLVMTSGNRTDEPIATNNDEALERLKDLADAFLLHDREIYVPCDDSVVRIVDDRELPIRRSRGYAPMPIRLPFKLPEVLAVGGEIKNTFCLVKDDFAFMSQHIGDMENLETLWAFELSANQISKLFRVEPEIIACDKHPSYLSSKWAKETGRRCFPKAKRIVEVQHHHAHIASVMAESGLDGALKVIGFAFDGTGYGDDGAIWGGEVLLADYAGFERSAYLKYLPLPGGNASIKKPYRAALAYLYEAGVEWDEGLRCVAASTETELGILRTQLEREFNTVPTSSMGRLFDVVAAIAGVRQTITYEAQGAIELEALIDESVKASYEFDIEQVRDDGPVEIDCSRLIRSVAKDALDEIPVAEISAKFHNAVAELIVELSLHFRERDSVNRVALSGGCFQNVALSRKTLAMLETNGFEVFTHRLVPPNDGGLALGQAVIAGYNYLK